MFEGVNPRYIFTDGSKISRGASVASATVFTTLDLAPQPAIQMPLCTQQNVWRFPTPRTYS